MCTHIHIQLHSEVNHVFPRARALEWKRGKRCFDQIDLIARTGPPSTPNPFHAPCCLVISARANQALHQLQFFIMSYFPAQSVVTGKNSLSPHAADCSFPRIDAHMLCMCMDVLFSLPAPSCRLLHVSPFAHPLTDVLDVFRQIPSFSYSNRHHTTPQGLIS